MNKRHVLAAITGLLSLALGVLAVNLVWFDSDPGDSPPPPAPPVPLHGSGSVGESISGPYSYKNLTVYLIHGKNVLGGKTPLALDEAITKKVVIVHETGDVNELQIENVSDAEEVYVQAGDIVKGGRQDRVLAVDLIVPARSGKMPIDAFCVEHGRWSHRGSESNVRFESANETVVSKDLKIAAKQSKSQGQVWAKVEEAKTKLTAATNANVSSNASNSSLPLALEHSSVREDAGEYVKALAEIVKGGPDVIGFVFAINGEVNSSDVYGSSALFAKLWPRLLKAAAIEAVAESYKGSEHRVVDAAEMNSFLAAAAAAEITERREVTDRIAMVYRETESAVAIESLDRGVMLHSNYLKR
jgi:hypothetical protein